MGGVSGIHATLSVSIFLTFFLSQNNCHLTISIQHLLFFSTIILLFIEFHPT